jgi:hypothetical protein
MLRLSWAPLRACDQSECLEIASSHAERSSSDSNGREPTLGYEDPHPTTAYSGDDGRLFDRQQFLANA